MNNKNPNKPVASLTNRKTTLRIFDVPAKLGRNDNVVDVHFFHNSVSREHCLFECVSRRFTVKDLGSYVGTFVNGVQLEPGVQYYIEDGDKITIGQVKFVFHADYEELGRREQNAARMGRQNSHPDAGQPLGMQQDSMAQGMPAMQRNMMPENQPAGMPGVQGNMMPENRPADMPVMQGNMMPENRPADMPFMQSSMLPENQPMGRVFRGPDGRKRAIVSARPLVHFEYDENEVIYIDTGLRPAAKKQRYTLDIPLEDVEEITKAEPEYEDESAAAPEYYEDESVAAPEYEDRPAAAPASQPVWMPEPDLVFEDEPTMVISDESTIVMGADPEIPKGPVMVLKWRDMDNGEEGNLTVDHFPFYIGRKSGDNDFAILKRSLSRRHLAFREDNGEVAVYDENSTNGVLVNGSWLRPDQGAVLKQDDVIEAGNIAFIVEEI